MKELFTARSNADCFGAGVGESVRGGGGGLAFAGGGVEGAGGAGAGRITAADLQEGSGE